MNRESFKPISVKSPTKNNLIFQFRCLFDLQLKTIASNLYKEIRLFPSGEIIDIGAGESPWKDWLPAQCSYKGLDIENSDEFGMSKFKPSVTLYDGKAIPFDSNTFDGALCIEVLEHAYDPDLLLSEVHRVLKHHSPLLLTVPWSARRHHIPFDYHRFTRDRLSDLFTKH